MPLTFDKSTVLKMLADLKRRDKRLNNFGASVHRYELNPPLRKSKIDSFESKHKVRLPEDYRLFITEIGNGGAGPYYGVFRFGEQDDCHDFCTWAKGDLVGDLGARFPHKDRWNLPRTFWNKMPNPAPDIAPDEEDRLMEAWNKELEKHYWNPKIMNGAIPICHLGCALRHWLVIHGPQKGTVWADDRVDEGGVYPLRQKSKRVTFADWYMSWLRKPLKV